MANIPLTTTIALIALMFLTGFMAFGIYIYIRRLKARFSLLLKLYLWFILGTLMLALFSVQIGSYLFYFIVVFFSILAGMHLLPPALIDWRKDVKRRKRLKKRRRAQVNVVSYTLLVGIALLAIYVLFPYIMGLYTQSNRPQFDQCSHAILGIQAADRTGAHVGADTIRQCQQWCSGRAEAPQCDVSGIGPLPRDAEFVSIDNVTKGNWQGVYGSTGYILFAANRSTVDDVISLPLWIDEWAVVPYETIPGFLGVPSTDPVDRSMMDNDSADTRALQHPVTGRIESEVWYRPDNTWEPIYLEIPINVSDGDFHNVSLYFADYRNFWNESKMARDDLAVQIVDSNRNRVLEQWDLSLTDWHEGIWFRFRVRNDFIIRLDSRGNIGAYHELGFPGVFFE